MICKVKSVIEKYSLFDNVKSVAVGFSGGADSLCLLHILNSIKDEYGITVKAVHVNHNLRGEAAKRDEEAAVKICKAMGIELLVFSEDIRKLSSEMGVGLEQCGRIIRYECFSKAGCDAIATAHTLSDSIETMLFNLIRGTGIKGLCSIPAKRGPNIIRPLIECTRDEIEKYCIDNSLQYVTDESNLSDDYTRNFIRHNIVPLFSRVNPDYNSGLLRAMQNLSADNDFISVCTNDLLKSAACEGGYSAEKFKNAHPAIRRAAISDILSKVMKKPPESRHIDLADKAVCDLRGKIELSKGLYLCVSGDIISFQTVFEDYPAFFANETEKNKYHTCVGTLSLEIIENPDMVLPDDIDLDKAGEKYFFSPRREGDSFFSKKRGNTKTLKKLFNEMKIPIQERELIPVLRTNETLLWVWGVGTDGRFSANKGTHKILRIKKED